MGTKRSSALKTLLDPSTPQAKRPRISSGSTAKPTPADPTYHTPTVLHRPHPDSRCGIKFHSVPYPLTLMPYASWSSLHHRHDTSSLKLECPVCAEEMPATLWHRKLFLVAERLLFEEMCTPARERERNMEGNWEVNFGVGVWEPFVEDVTGGWGGDGDGCWPFRDEEERRLVSELVARGGVVTERNWEAWRVLVEEAVDDGLDGEGRQSSQPLEQQEGGRKEPAAALPSSDESNTPSKQLRADLAWAENLPDEEIDDWRDHLKHLSALLQKKKDVLAVHEAAGTTPPAGITASYNIITAEIKETEDMIRVKECQNAKEEAEKKAFLKAHYKPPLTSAEAKPGVMSTPPATQSTPPSSSQPTTTPKTTAESTTSFTPRLPTPPSSSPLNPVKQKAPHNPTTTSPSRRISLTTLAHLYTALDNLTRGSTSAAKFLEAYAEFLRWDLCQACWVREMILPDNEGEEEVEVDRRKGGGKRERAIMEGFVSATPATAGGGGGVGRKRPWWRGRKTRGSVGGHRA